MTLPECRSRLSSVLLEIAKSDAADWDDAPHDLECLAVKMHYVRSSVILMRWGVEFNDWGNAPEYSPLAISWEIQRGWVRGIEGERRWEFRWDASDDELALMIAAVRAVFGGDPVAEGSIAGLEGMRGRWGEPLLTLLFEW